MNLNHGFYMLMNFISKQFAHSLKDKTLVLTLIQSLNIKCHIIVWWIEHTVDWKLHIRGTCFQSGIKSIHCNKHNLFETTKVLHD